MTIKELVLSPPSEGNPISGLTDQVLKTIRMRTHAYNKTLNKMLNEMWVNLVV